MNDKKLNDLESLVQALQFQLAVLEGRVRYLEEKQDEAEAKGR